MSILAALLYRQLLTKMELSKLICAQHSKGTLEQSEYSIETTSGKNVDSVSNFE